MKNFLFAILFLIFCASCMNPGKFTQSERRERKQIYVSSFKMTYFQKMLLAGFNNSIEIRKVLNEDHSKFGEIVLSLEDYRFIDSIVSADKSKLVADSAASIGRRAEGAEGKQVFGVALSRFQSKWLNDVAVKRSRSYTNIVITAN